VSEKDLKLVSCMCSAAPYFSAERHDVTAHVRCTSSLSTMSGNYCLQKDSLYTIEAVRLITKIPINKPMQLFGAVVKFLYWYGVSLFWVP
jgi:hypothetical protein